MVGIKVEQFTDDNDYYWYLDSKLEGISDSNCSNLAHNSYTLLTAVCFKRVCQSILNADFSTVENWRFVFISLQANKQP